MAKHEIELTETEEKSMAFVSKSVKDWIDNVAKNRARIAKEVILELNMKHCNANGITLATGEDAQVTQAFTLEVVKTAKQRGDEFDG